MKINEKDLENYIVHFNNKKVILKYKGLHSSNIYIEKLKIKFYLKGGILYIKDCINKHNIKLNMSLAYNIDIDNLHNRLLIQLDNNVDIVIKVKN